MELIDTWNINHLITFFIICHTYSYVFIIEKSGFNAVSAYVLFLI